MKNDQHEHELPPRLVDGEGASAELLRRFSRHAAHPTEEAMAWDRTLGRLARAPSGQRGRLVVAAACGALAAAVGLYLTLAPGSARVATDARAPGSAVDRPAAQPQPRAQPAAQPESRPRAQPSPSPSPSLAGNRASARIELGQAAVGLPVGPAELVGEARVTLAPGGAARASRTDGATRVELASGALELELAKQEPARARRFEVVVMPYRFVALGTAFRIERHDDVVALSVADGHVGVYRGAELVAAVDGGGRWTNRAVRATTTTTTPRTATTTTPARVPASRAPTVPAAPGLAPVGDTCATRASDDPRAAVACYLGEAGGADLRAEVALYEIARLRRDALGEPASALDALRDYRARFPTGRLRSEVDLSIAELLPRLGRYREALDETDALLRAHRAGERVSELQLLRGHVLRAGLGDWAGALGAYTRAAETDDARAADPATYWRAVCLERLGRRDEARDAYASYLSRPHPTRAAEAARRLEALGQRREH